MVLLYDLFQELFTSIARGALDIKKQVKDVIVGSESYNNIVQKKTRKRRRRRKKKHEVAALTTSSTAETNTINNNANYKRYWSDLPDDLLEEIFRSKKIDPIDLLRFRDVCKSWKHVININMEYYKHRFSILKIPTLFIGYYNNRHTSYNYSRIKSEVYRLKVPDHPGDEYMYSSGPWLLKYSCLSTANKVVFPSNYILRIFHCFKDISMEIDLPHNNHGFVSPLKFCISSPSSINQMVVLVIDGKGKRLAFCVVDSQGKRPKSRPSWHVIDTAFMRKTINTTAYDDVLVDRNYLYVLPSEGCLLYKLPLQSFFYSQEEVKFISKPNNVFAIASSNNDIFGELSLGTCTAARSRRYLLQTSPLMVVIRYMDYWECTSSSSSRKKNVNKHKHYYCCKTKYFEVFNATTAETVESLDDKAIFLARYDSKIVLASNVKCKPNCIYFVDDAFEGINLSSECDFGVYNMETKTVERFCNAPFNRWVLMDSTFF